MHAIDECRLGVGADTSADPVSEGERVTGSVGNGRGNAAQIRREVLPIRGVEEAAEHRDAYRTTEFAGQVVHGRGDALLGSR